jgi:hypothetical protein
MYLKVAAFPAVVIVAIAAAGLYGPAEKVQTVTEIRIPEAHPEIAPPVNPPQEKVTELSPGGARKASFRTEKLKPVQAANKPAKIREPQRMPGKEFYAISYTGEDMTAGGRIMRVELNRSSLFALGINLPLENDVATVKADLLIGSDGVTRGVRVVE